MTTLVGLHYKDKEEGILLACDSLATDNDGKELYKSYPKCAVSEEDKFVFAITGSHKMNALSLDLMQQLATPSNYGISFNCLADIHKQVVSSFKIFPKDIQETLFWDILIAARFNGNLEMYSMRINAVNISGINVDRNIYSAFCGSGSRLAYDVSCIKQLAAPLEIEFKKKYDEWIKPIQDEYKKTGILDFEKIKAGCKYQVMPHSYKTGKVFNSPFELSLEEALADVDNSMEAAQADPFTKGKIIYKLDKESIQRYNFEDKQFTDEMKNAEYNNYLQHLIVNTLLQRNEK